MSHFRNSHLSPRRFLSFGLVLTLTIFVWHSFLGPAYGAQLGSRSLQLSNNTVSAASTYQLLFNLSTAGTLGSIEVQFCSNDPMPQDPCVAPTGLSLSGASLTAQTGQTGFTISSSSTANKLILTRTPSPDSIAALSYTLANVINPSSTGSYFARIVTYASNDASGTSSDYGGIAFSIANSLSISAEVPPYLIFCVGITIPQLNCASAEGNYIDFGEFSSTITSKASSQMLASTNGENGYAISLSGTTLESGNNVINPLVSNDVSRPGTAQFGLNLRANSSPADGNDPSGPGLGEPTTNYAEPNFYRFEQGDVIASYAQPDNIREYTASYMVNVPSNQAPGVYVSTVTYVCVANF